MKYILKIAICFAVLVYMGVYLCNWFLGQSIKKEVASESSQALVSESSAQSESSEASVIPPSTASKEASAAISQPIKETKFRLSKDKVKQGDLLVLIGENVEALPVAQSLLMENIKAYKDENGLMLALIPIKYTHNPGSYYVSVSLDGVKTDLPVEVLKTDFPVVDIEVDDEVKEETIESKTANDEYMAKVQPLKAVNRDKVLWQGKFMPPLKEYRITSEFGEIRTVNGAPSDRHGGLDMAAPTGTPVYATNDGEVLFAEKIQLTGNTIMIEHGLGLKSHYYHMDSLNVKAGDMVKKGDLIGTVGTTGFSTGPHLHFAVSVGRGYFNPQFVLDEEIV